MTDPQPLIHELLGMYSPVFSLYVTLMKEKTQIDLSDTVIRGKNDRDLFRDASDGFLAYLISRERSDKMKKINRAVSSLFLFLNILLGDESKLLSTFSDNILESSKTLETEAFSVYRKAFYSD